MVFDHKKSPVSDCLAAEETGLGISALDGRLERYAKGKDRALHIADYIRQTYPSEKDLVAKLSSCAKDLLFKEYVTGDLLLHGAITCKKHLLCPFCAIRRGAKYLRAYMERLAFLYTENALDGDLRPFFVTLTIRDGLELKLTYKAIKGAFSRYLEMRRNSLKGQKLCQLSKVEGAVYSFEVKRGRNSGLWHPHVHMVAWCREAIDVAELSREWLELTGDSFIVDVRPLVGKDGKDSLIAGFCEVFKYAVKFSDMNEADTFEAYTVLSRKRLVGSFGFLYGVKPPEDLLDDDLEGDIPYRLLMYQYSPEVAKYLPAGHVDRETGEITPFMAEGGAFGVEEADTRIERREGGKGARRSQRAAAAEAERKAG